MGQTKADQEGTKRFRRAVGQGIREEVKRSETFVARVAAATTKKKKKHERGHPFRSGQADTGPMEGLR